MQDEEDEKAETGMCKEEDEKGLRGYLQGTKKERERERERERGGGK